MKQMILIILFIAGTACSYRQAGVKVEYKGALMDIMHGGDLSGKIHLKSVANKQRLYALGAAEGLKGEIIILGGKSIISEVENQQVKTTQTFDRKAALLVYTEVKNWIEARLPDSITTYKQLEAFLPQLARHHNIPSDKPFPFLLEGKVQIVDWHVIDWEPKDRDHTHEKHKNSGLKGRLQDSDVELLGFYSEKHQGIFTHRGSFMHLHLHAKTPLLSAHVDDLTVGKGMIVKLPKS